MRTLAEIRQRADGSPFVVLSRAFFAQFFASESATSDVQVRQTIIWVLAFLVTPGFFLVIGVLPAFQFALVTRSIAMTEAILLVLGSVFVTYSMVTTGFIAVFVWDALAFDRRDAMVLGPLPLSGSLIISAKLAAMATFLLGASLSVNVITAVPFATSVGSREGGTGFMGHLAGHLISTVGAATFIFAAIVTIRGIIALVGGARLAARIGSALQFVFVSALLCFMILVPAVDPERARFLMTDAARWTPPAWFLGLFERLIGVPDPHFALLARRAVAATTIAVVGAVAVSIVGFRRQMQLALAPSAFTGALGNARVSRTLARWLVAGNPAARAVSDFILLTTARNRAQQAPIAMNAAIAMALITAALVHGHGMLLSVSRVLPDVSALMRPRTAVLWIPLLLAYWTTIGLRASFFVPSELPAAWSFRAHAPEPAAAYWSALRSAMIAFVVPRTLLVCALLVPLLGWRGAAWHAVVVCALVVLLIEVVALTINFIPFTRPYEPGHAKLKSRWPLYFLGMYVFAYWPTRLEMRIWGSALPLLEWLGCMAVVIVALELLGRRRARGWPPHVREEAADDAWGLTVLNLGGLQGVQGIK